MNVIYESCAGLDVHKKTVVACVRTAGLKETRCAGYLPHPRRVGTQTGYIPLLGAAYYVVLRGCTTTTRGEGWRGCNV